MNPQRYEASATPKGKWWAIRVDSLPGVFAQASSYQGVEAAAIEAISLYLDTDPNAVVVTVTPDIDADLTRKIDERHRRVRELEQMQIDMASASRELARDLIDAGFSQRDAAQLLGVSFQRINQLVRH